jgi:hypothetical protein
MTPPDRNKLAYSFEAQTLSTNSNLVKANREELENQVIRGRFSDVSNPRPSPIKCISITSSEKNFENQKNKLKNNEIKTFQTPLYE